MRELRRKKKRREVVAYSQQTWRRYNHVKTQMWSPCDLLIHAFSMHNIVFYFFLVLFCVLAFMWIDELKCCFDLLILF
jgi:hypothetical protein